jgi:hypothetical protein
MKNLNIVFAIHDCIYQSEAWRGCQVRKRRYFYGLKIQIMATEKGQLFEFFLTLGSFSGTSAYRLNDFDLSEHA